MLYKQEASKQITQKYTHMSHHTTSPLSISNLHRCRRRYRHLKLKYQICINVHISNFVLLLSICSCHDLCVWCSCRRLRALLCPVLTRGVINDLHSFIPEPVKSNWVTAERCIGHLFPSLKNVQQSQLWAANVPSIMSCMRQKPSAGNCTNICSAAYQLQL